MTTVNLKTLTGGAYIPPARLKMMQQNITDKSSEEYQRIAWEALKKTLNGLVNKINKDNFTIIVNKLLSENILRGRGILAKTIIVAQDTSPALTDIYAALVSVVNSKFPQIGLLIVNRLLNDFRKAYKKQNKRKALTTARFFAHLVNHQVIDEILILELMMLLLRDPTDTSVEIAIALMKECGCKLEEVCKQGSMKIFDTIRNLLNEGMLTKRVNYMIEVLFQIRKDKFRDFPPIKEGLDIVDEDDRTTHYIELTAEVDPEEKLNVFQYDDKFQENEGKYEKLKEELFGDDNSDEEEDGEGDSENEDGVVEPNKNTVEIEDHSHMAQEHLRKRIYLTIQSSLTPQEACHKLLQIKLRPDQYYEMASMIFDYGAQLRSYETRVGEMAVIMCEVCPDYVKEFEKLFCENYSIIHRMDLSKIGNISYFFAHLFVTDCISWGVLFVVHLREEQTTSSGRIFLKYFFTELRDRLGIDTLIERLGEEKMITFFQNIFPRDNLPDTKFAINFFIAIGLGPLTKELRKFYDEAKMQRKIAAEKQAEKKSKKRGTSSSSSESGSSNSSNNGSSSSDDSSSSSSAQEVSPPKKKLKKTKN